MGLGGIAGSITAIFLTQILTPYTIFTFYSFLHLGLFFFVYFLKEGETEKSNMKSNLRKMLTHLKLPLVYKTMIFLFFARALVPSFPDIMYYFLINVIGFSKGIIASLTLVIFFGLFTGSIIYNRFLKHIDYPKLMFCGLIIN